MTSVTHRNGFVLRVRFAQEKFRIARPLLVLLFACVNVCASVVNAQSNGGLFLLLPFGAHAVGQGEAVAADTTLGSEGLWWNPAALARLPKKEFAFHDSRTIVATNDMIIIAVPSKALGTITASAYQVNFGDQPLTVGNGDVAVGTITNRNYLFALSYATPIGKHLNIGVTGKYAMLQFRCSGACGTVPNVSGKTYALDIGAQYTVTTAIPFTVGAVIRNLGPDLQVKDKEQADPLPRLIQVGAKVRVPINALADAGASLDLLADVQHASALTPDLLGSLNLGASLGYHDQLFIRGGYKSQRDGGGPSIGIGFERGAFGLDIARRFDALSSGIGGQTPTYVSLRARF